MDDFKLNIALYGDENNLGTLFISDNSKQWNKLPNESFPIDNVTPEKIGNLITEYLKRECT